VGLTGVGVQIQPDHRYRVTVYYTNGTGQRLPDGGMGVVAGLFKPASETRWPTAVATDPLYVRDLRHYLRLSSPTELAAQPGAAASTVR
jgi:hypothetical protein